VEQRGWQSCVQLVGKGMKNGSKKQGLGASPELA